MKCKFIHVQCASQTMCVKKESDIDQQLEVFPFFQILGEFADLSPSISRLDL